MLEKSHLAEEQQLIDQLYQHWIIGSNETISRDMLPDSWQNILQGGPQDKVNLFTLALASQHQSFLYRPKSTLKFTPVQPLPCLRLPTQSSGSRPLFRRALQCIEKASIKKINFLLYILESHNVTAHPLDWLPDSQAEDLPDVYWPWVQWAANAQRQYGETVEVVTEENWDEWFPAERLKHLKKMRITAPGKTRGLIQECASRENAEKRIKIVKVLEIGLSEEDIEFIQALTRDRSQKISLLATQLLARIGIRIDNQENDNIFEEARELASFFELKKVGIIKKQLSIIPRKLKSKKQQAIRTELLEKVPSHIFAEALNIKPSELAIAWQFSENRELDNINFLKNTALTFSDENILTLLSSILDNIERDESLLSLIQFLQSRLDQQTRNSLMFKLFKNRKVKLRFLHCLDFLDKQITSINFDDITSTYAWNKLVNDIQSEIQENGHIAHYEIIQELIVLGLILPQAIAIQVLDKIVDLGLTRADPTLDCLKFNAQITLLI